MTNKKINEARRLNKMYDLYLEAEETEEKDWKKTAFALAKAYGIALEHLKELNTRNVHVETENGILHQIIRKGVKT